MKKVMLILISSALFFGVPFFLGYKLSTWRSASFIPENSANFRECIYKDPLHKEVKISSCGSDFTVNYVENTSLAVSPCFNPTFPSIHIAADDRCNAFLQIIYADCRSMEEWQFIAIQEHLCCRIDTSNKDNDPYGVYPFYTKCNQLYDSPHWEYAFFSRPLSFWRAHAYAVVVDYNNKKISCLGGISWGYRLPWYSCTPKMILPASLSMDDWKDDWKLFSTVLPDFRGTESSF